MFLRWSTCEVWWECHEWDRIRNEEMRRSARIKKELESSEDQRVMIWFGHVDRMDEYRMGRRVLIAAVSSRLVQGRPRLFWMNGVKMVFGNRGTTVEAARKWAKDRKELRAIYEYVDGWVSLNYFCLVPVFSQITALPRSVAYQPKSGGMPLHVAVNWINLQTE